MSNIAMKTLKIKDTFPNLQNKKIKQVQKLISGNHKPKPHINMTTKVSRTKSIDLVFSHFLFYLLFF